MHYLKFAVPIALVVIVGAVVLAAPNIQQFSMFGGTGTTVTGDTTPPNPILCPTGQHSDGTECVPDSSTNTTFSASLTSGSAPLSVTFSNMVGGPLQGSLVIRYGDGSADTATRCVEGGSEVADRCTMPGINTHTYTSAGTYTAQLINVKCIGTDCETVLGTATITVSGGASNQTFSASPASGLAPLSVMFTHISPPRVTTDCDQRASVDHGDGTTYPIPSECYWARTHTHAYASPGTYVAILKNTSYCQGDLNCVPPVLGTITITVR